MESEQWRVGQGWDVHALVPGRDLIMGGVTIPFSKGLLGHSDADVLLHALIDALLGAMGKGDIGEHFPDTDPQWKNADSKKLLSTVAQSLRQEGWQVVNVDSTVVAQAPRLASHLPLMRETVAGLLGTDPQRVNIKAKTAEKMGPVGQGQSIEAQAVVLIRSTR
jgi:2-C-methyl-D-erythritol 2,4-cyclodiphosphate synthase